MLCKYQTVYLVSQITDFLGSMDLNWLTRWHDNLTQQVFLKSFCGRLFLWLYLNTKVLFSLMWQKKKWQKFNKSSSSLRERKWHWKGTNINWSVHFTSHICNITPDISSWYSFAAYNVLLIKAINKKQTQRITLTSWELYQEMKA